MLSPQKDCFIAVKLMFFRRKILTLSKPLILLRFSKEDFFGVEVNFVGIEDVFILNKD